MTAGAENEIIPAVRPAILKVEKARRRMAESLVLRTVERPEKISLLEEKLNSYRDLFS